MREADVTKAKAEQPPSFADFIASRQGRGRVSPRCVVCELRDRAPELYEQILIAWASGFRGTAIAHYVHDAWGISALKETHFTHHFDQGHHNSDPQPEPIEDELQKQLRAVFDSRRGAAR